MIMVIKMIDMYFFLLKAFFAGILTALSTSLVGVHVVLRRMSFFGDGIAHIAFAAAAVGAVFNASSFFTALLFSILSAILLGYLSQKGVHEDTGVGILFSLSMATGIILFSVKRQQRSLMSYLFGDILTVSNKDLFFLFLIAALVILFTLLWKDRLIYMTFDKEFLKAMGVGTEVVYYSFLILLAATIVISVRTVGVILVSAFLIVPAASSNLILKDYRKMFCLAPILSISSSIVGITLSIWIDVPVGPIIVVVQSVIFFSMLFLKKGWF